MTAQALSLLQGLIASLDPEESAKHSMLDHHAVGVDYVNLLRTDRLTVKLYVMEPDRIVHAVKRRADIAYLVNPHDHAYAFDTFVLAGHVDDWEFERTGGCEQLFDWWSHRLVYDTPTRTIVGRHEGNLAGTTPSFEGLYRKPTPADITRLVARATEAIS